MTMPKPFEGFSGNASDFIRLRRALYGAEDAQALMMRCYKKHPKAKRITEPMLLNCWQEQDDAINAALGIDSKAERKARMETFLGGRK